MLAEAMTIGWTQNVVILEAELTPQERAWYIKAAGQFGWSKLELQQRIVDHAHLGRRHSHCSSTICSHWMMKRSSTTQFWW